MRRAKIVCTLGPASSDPDVLRSMIEAGMDIARLNFSHGTHEQHKEMLEKIRHLSRSVGRPVGVLQDLQGPKIRVGTFEEGQVELAEGAEFTITVEEIMGDQRKVGTTYPELNRDVAPGDIMLLDDGLLRLRVEAVEGPEVHTRVEVGGILKNNKGINLPTAAVSAPSLTEKDKVDLEYGLSIGVDYVALSFVRSALDIHQLRALFPEDSEVKVISKIEKPQAVDALDEIIAVSDGIMIARGDLGVELPPQEVPIIQKQAIAEANALGRLSITATQMLDSMTENPRPTRAEASDVANAVLDGTDAVMLSGETATGRYPIESVKMMASIIEEVESSPTYQSVPPPSFIQNLKTFPNALAKAASVAADELDVAGIVILTFTGSTARLMMTYRPNKPIIAITPNEILHHQMALYWGVRSHLLDFDSSGLQLEGDGRGQEMTHATEGILQTVEELMLEHHGAQVGDEIIVVMGFPITLARESNLMKFHRIGEWDV
jgi:pyruvate kinase